MRFHRQTITVEQARSKLLARITPTTQEKVSLGEAFGRILAQDLVSPCDYPGFDRSPLDGYAVRATDTESATVQQPVYLQVVEEIAAGDVPKMALGPGMASRIMTGAMLPVGADAVIMFEQTVNPGEKVQQVGIKRKLTAWENVSRRGEEVEQGSVIARSGEAVDAGMVALLASFGITEVPVYRKPTIGILSTGSELIDFDQPLRPGMIRDSNSLMLQMLVLQAGGIPVLFDRLSDHSPAVKATIQRCADRVDLLVTTGGVSVGDKDIIASLVDEAEVELLFNHVAMRPGSPTTAAMIGSTPLCALSGNPGACHLGFFLFVAPVIRKMANLPAEPPRWRAILAADCEKPSPFPRYLRGRIEVRNTTLYAIPDPPVKSGNVSRLKGSDCFIVIPAGGRGKRAGEEVEILCYQHYLQ